jgi:transcriptional regulator with AAA-type ATPase domain
MEQDTQTKTATSERAAGSDASHPQLVLVLDRARPTAGSARHSLASIARVTVGRARARQRGAARVVEEGVPTLSILLPDDRVSALHAVIERREGRWHFADSDSTNGSRVNGRDTRRCALEDGDVLEIGHTFFRFRAAMPTPVDAPGDVDATDLRDLAGAFGTVLPWLTRDLATLERVARSDVPVLLRGETGTGKEVLARSVHAQSGRRGPFVAVNCGALPPALVESLLFGHKRGAFSGATQDELGLVRTAEGGTLFLDEVGDLGPAAQVALLRVLQEREVLPVGGTRPVATDVRIVSATHRPVDGSPDFRHDLLARLSGFTFAVPPLRGRIDDLGMLVAAILAKVAGERTAELSLASDLVYAMLAHDWPFNVREVEQRLRTAVVLAGDARIQLSHAWAAGASPGGGADPAKGAQSPATSLSEQDEALRRDLEAKLTQHAGNVTRVGEALGKRRTTVQRWLRRLGIDPDRFR